MTWQAQWVRKNPIFKTATRILEIGAGAFGTSKYLAQRHPDKQIYSIDFVLSEPALRELAEIPSNLHVIKSDATDMNMFSEDFFDFAFSVAVTEHIPLLGQHLTEMFRIIRPGGEYAFWQAPFWSCSMGHHYFHSTTTCPVPHYAHLYMTRDELQMHLIANGQSPKPILSMIYDRYDLSRHTRSDVEKIVETSPFKRVEWSEDEDQNYTAELADQVLRKNLYGIEKSDLRVKGARVRLQKLAPDLSTRVRSALSHLRSSNAGH